MTPAYSLHVVREILESAGTDDLVLDPFSGTGTTALVATSLGIRAHAVDINPFLVWLGNRKLKKYARETTSDLLETADRINRSLRTRASASREWTPDLHKIEKWWDEPVLEALSRLFAHIVEEGRHRRVHVVADLMKIAFCKAMIENSNASFSHQSMSFKKPDGNNQGRLFPAAEATTAVMNSFSVAVADVAASLDSDQPVSAGRVYEGDARRLEVTLPEAQYTVVVTSPPYPNRMSYIRELRPYMYWLGYLTNGRAAGELDWEAIGGTWGCATSNLGTWKPASETEVPFRTFRQIVEAISTDHPLLGRYVHKYFLDIQAHLRSLRRVIAPGGRCYYIVGNSKFYGTLLPVEEIYASLFSDMGFVNTKISVLRKRNSKKELFEYLVYAEAP